MNKSKRDTQKPGILMLTLISLLCLISPVANATVIEYPTSQPGRALRLVLTNHPGGMAIDKHGNIYYSDQGDGSFGAGVIRMIPKDTGIPIMIRTGLDIPGDIELTRDGKALVVTEAYGKVNRYYFGISARFQYPGGYLAYGLTLYVDMAGSGTTKGYKQMVDDFYLVPDLLVPENSSADVSLIVEYPDGHTIRYPMTLGQTGEKDPFGQTIKYFMLNQ